MLDAVHGPAPGDPYVASAARARPTAEEVGADPGKLRIGLMTEPLGRTSEIDPEVQEAARGAAGAARGARPHRRRRTRPTCPTAEPGGPFDVVESFLTRWQAGQAASLDQFASLLGRELGPDDVEPLTWALAELGRRKHSGQYLNAVGLHQALTRLIADWFEQGHDLLLTPTMGEPPPPLGTFDDSGPDPLRAIERARKSGDLHGAVQRHRAPGDLAAAALDRARVCRSGVAAGRPARARGRPDPRRRPGRAGAAVGRSPPAGLGRREAARVDSGPRWLRSEGY